MYFIDVQGTLLKDSDKEPINKAVELIDYLNKRGLAYVVITNNTKKLSDDFLKELNSKGLRVDKSHYLDPFCLLGGILKSKRVACFGAREFINSIEALGYELDYTNPQAVLVASYDDFKFSDFASMIELISNGAEFIALHQTSIYKKNSRLYPGVGAISSMITAACGVEPKVIGKPSDEFYHRAFELLKAQNKNVKMQDILIISDDAKGDLVGAKKLGMKTALVLSGKCDDVKKSGVEPEFLDLVYKDISEFYKDIYDEN